MRIKNGLCLLLLAASMSGHAQSKSIDYSTIKVAGWIVQQSDSFGYAMGQYSGKPAFLLNRKIFSPKSANIAYPKDLDFTNGSIELDIAAPSGKNGFVGIAFHIRDSNHYETLYFRPGSSGTGYAVQYMPKKKPEFNWWDYEALSWQAKATLPETTWFHVKVVVKNREMKVYLDNGPNPVMTRSDLDPDLSHGSVGFWLGNCSGGAYRNLKIIKT